LTGQTTICEAAARIVDADADSANWQIIEKSAFGRFFRLSGNGCRQRGGMARRPAQQAFHYNTGTFARAGAPEIVRVNARALPVQREQTPCRRESPMKVIVWLIRVLLFVVLLVLALANQENAQLHFAGYVWQAPLILIGLAFFAVGLLAGLVSAVPALVRLRLENGRLKRELRAAREQAPVAVVEPPMPPVI
jgi:uncharacterized integral membrane protein